MPEVEEDRIKLTELLSEYNQIVIRNVENVLEELQYKSRTGRRKNSIEFISISLLNVDGIEMF